MFKSQNGVSLRTVQLVTAICVSLILIAPLVMLFVASLKTDRFEIMADMGSWRAFWVSTPSFDNFAEIMSFSGPYGFARYLVNSLIILVGTLGLGIIFCSMAGYVLARGSMRGRAALLAAVISLYIIPQESIMMPLLLIVTRMGLGDGFLAQILPWAANPIYIFIFYQFFSQIPIEIHEAATLDGTKPFQAWRYVYMPMSVPATATVAILMGIESWNQYLWPVLITQTSYARPISVAIAAIFGNDEIYWNYAMAASVTMMIPILIFYMLFQRWFVSSFISSAVKG
ncbi:carbohydrate ABC transporter permease [Rhodophyticola sp. CCM32]|uniref:carbohydrate ABC transporter permease n=1 Tax=Rhodophyticola sp. CCM32 TaxID=2916397 RepID=UPI001AEFC2BC|nr:carbohydrate ABC transporter permease [Rhodophyticola sp. CCM32]